MAYQDFENELSWIENNNMIVMKTPGQCKHLQQA